MKSYSIDPDLISLDQFRELTAGKEMLPGRVSLQKGMEERFAILKESGIRHLGDLLANLSSRAKIHQYSRQSGLGEDYLIILKREAGSYLSRPFPLSDFPGIPFEYIEILKSQGLRHTRDLFEKLQSDQQPAELTATTGIPAYRLKELFSLCDLSRITGVGGIFARVLYEAGIRSAKEYSLNDAASTLKRCREVIDKYGYAAGKLGEKDVQYGINYARLVAVNDQKSE
jgi:hypothetical protein